MPRHQGQKEHSSVGQQVKQQISFQSGTSKENTGASGLESLLKLVSVHDLAH